MGYIMNNGRSESEVWIHLDQLLVKKRVTNWQHAYDWCSDFIINDQRCITAHQLAREAVDAYFNHLQQLDKQHAET